MTNFDARTTCNSPLITDHKKAEMIMDKYGGTENFHLEQETEWKDGNPTFLGKYRICISAYDWFQLFTCYKEDDEDGAPGELNWDEDTTEDFLKEIQPFLAEDLIVQSIGAEKRRFPFSAYSWIVPKGKGKILTAGLPHTLKQYKKFNK